MSGTCKRNIILIVLDACRADIVYREADKVNTKTPFLDALIEHGAVFTRAFSTTSTTSPSFASILTGLYPPRHGLRSLYGYKLNDVKTLPEVLRENGYNTYAEVTGPLVESIGVGRGFTEFRYREKEEDIHSRWGQTLLDRVAVGHYESPWFLFLHLWELHLPIVVPESHDSREYGRNRYERALSAVDEYLQRLVNAAGEDAVIVVLGDHGENIAWTNLEDRLTKTRRRVLKKLSRLGVARVDHLKIQGHGYHVYDYLTRIPLIFSGEGLFLGRSSDDLVSQIDVFPTLIDVLGIPTNDLGLEGLSLKPVLEGEKIGRTHVFLEACGEVIPDESKWLVGVRTYDTKYVYAPYSDDDKEELYDLRTDPTEKTNIVDSHRETASTLRKLIQDEYLGKRKSFSRRIAKIRGRLRERGRKEDALPET
ncbi:sulfatase-like hydrolase/transferase [Candidatus Bathyarchaeota archaeon]|nr:sulfatase-like hydrolase/transferase [Candidatus Bathyarchaeota archaeon]